MTFRNQQEVLESPLDDESSPAETSAQDAAPSEDGRRENILEAVLKLAEAEGFDKVSIRKIAARANVSPSLVTYHFKNKDRLIVEAWQLLHERESRRRDQAVGRASGLKRIEVGFQLALEEQGHEDIAPHLRLDFWSKTARTPALRSLFAEHRQNLLPSHIAGLQNSIVEGELDARFAEDLALLEDVLQAMTYGLHTWVNLSPDPIRNDRALQMLHLFLGLLRKGTV